MGGRSLKRCKGFKPCLLNPLAVPAACFSCKLYDGPRPKPPRALPGYEGFTSKDNPPSEDAIETTCAYCGRLFFGPKNKLYCSRSCYKKAYRQRRLARGNQNREFAVQKCVICGREFYPHTDPQHQKTCGGACKKQYLAQKYGIGIPKNYPPALPQQRGADMETRSNCPAHHLRECVAQIKRHNPDAALSPSSLDALAAMLSSRISWWRTISRPRQAVLLDIAVSYGVHGLMGMQPLLVAMRAGKWEQARQVLLNSRYAMFMAESGRGKYSVENARQLSTGAWTVIPEYVPGEDDEDEDDDEQLWF